MATENDMLALLSLHIGRDNGVRVDLIARTLGIPERRVRTLISALREQGYAVCGHPGSGYYMAQTADEIDETCRFLRSRALHSLHMEAQLRRLPLPDLIGQIKLPT